MTLRLVDMALAINYFVDVLLHTISSRCDGGICIAIALGSTSWAILVPTRWGFFDTVVVAVGATVAVVVATHRIHLGWVPDHF